MGERTTKLVGAAYGRVSTEQLAETEHGSLEQQRNLAKDWAEILTRKTGINHEIKYFLEDAAKSGATEDRAQYQKLLQLVRDRKISFIILKELSRAGRNLQSLMNLKELTQQHGVSLHIRGLPDVDLSTPTGEMMLHLMGTLAQYERAQGIQRLKDNIRSAALNNAKINGGPVVLGFDRNPKKKGFWIINETEIFQVITLMQVFLETGSLKYTSEEARRLGIKSKTGVHIRPKAMRNLLSNPKYIGRMEVVHGFKDEKRTWVDLPHGEAVPKDLFERVQEKLLEISRMENNQTKFDRRVYLLTGVLLSPDGSRFTGKSGTGRNGESYCYYWNPKTRLSLHTEDLERAVFERVIAALRSNEELIRFTAQLSEIKMSRLALLESNRKNLKSKFENLEEQERKTLDGLRDKLAGSAVAVTWLEEQIEKLKQERQHLFDELSEVEGEIKTLKTARTNVKEISDQFMRTLREIQKGEPVRARAFLRQVIESATVFPEGRIDLKWKLPNHLFTAEENFAAEVKWLRRS